MEVKDSKYVVVATYDLSNHMKIPIQKRNSPPTSSNYLFHARFRVLSALLTPIKLRIYNCSYRHHCKSVVHSGSIIDIVIPKNLSSFYIVLWFIVELHHDLLLKVDIITLTPGNSLHYC